MDNATLSLNCNYTTYSYTHYVYSTLSYLVFVGNGPAYPNCPDCVYDVTFNSSSLHNLNSSYIRISNATSDIKSFNESSGEGGPPVTLSVVGGQSPWVIWAAVNISSDNMTLDSEGQDALALMRVVDPFNISWCTVYNARPVPATEPEQNEDCADISDELPVLDSKSSIFLQDYSANSSINFTVFLALNSSNSYSQCSANVSIPNPNRLTNVQIACPTLPLTVNMKMIPANNTEGDTLSATLDIGWLLAHEDGVSLTVKTTQTSPPRSNCSRFQNISSRRESLPENNRYSLTHIPTPVNRNKSFSLSWNPVLLNFSQPPQSFQLVVYNQREPSCVLERLDNVSDAVLVSLACPHLEASFTPGGPITVTVSENYSSNANFSLAFLSSLGTEYAGVLLLPVSSDLEASPGHHHHHRSHSTRRLIITPHDLFPPEDLTTPPVVEHHERMKIWLLPIAGTIFAIVMVVIINIVLCLTE
nr:Ov8 putative glycoprotein [Ovine gammaherpesvirus 2]